jgi:hypothetical protein
LLSVVDEGSGGEIDPTRCRVEVLQEMASPSWRWIRVHPAGEGVRHQS